MKNISACLSHNTDEWKTPSCLYNVFKDQGYIDPCPYMADFDGLIKNYKHRKLFVNPPFSHLREWVDWCIEQYSHGCEVVLLMPSRTDTKYFNKLVTSVPCLLFFIKGVYILMILNVFVLFLLLLFIFHGFINPIMFL